MKTYDWIVIGGGITGTALSYELKKIGFSVLLIEQYSTPQNATCYGYGGIPYWSSTTALTHQLCTEGIALQKQLSQELEGNTEFRDIDLVLTLDHQDNPEAIATKYYSEFAIPPQYISAAEACQLEPLLNQNAIAGAFTVKHAHVNGKQLAKAYQSAYIRAGGEILIAQVQQILEQTVVTKEFTYKGQNIAVCAGGLSRSLLKASDISVRLYFTHAELIEMQPTEIKLRTMVMPADTKRFELETNVSDKAFELLWDDVSGQELALPSIDMGAIQFCDRSIKIGQISRVLTNPYAEVERSQSEAEIREKVGNILPALANLPGAWYHCLVAFSHDLLPLVGAVPDHPYIHLFTGFSSPMVYVPTLARRFATFMAGNRDEILPHLSPKRFA